MRKFLGTLVLIALAVGAVGLMRGWVRVSSEDQPGETHVEIKIDKEKIRQDTQNAAAKARQIGGGESETAEPPPPPAE